MKKFLLSLILVITTGIVNAQVDSLQEYTGKYKFAEGSPVSLVTITIENGVLFANSEGGNSELVRTSGDVFTIVAFEGVATFKRDNAKKIVGVKIELNDMSFEGTKTEGINVDRAAGNNPAPGRGFASSGSQHGARW